MSETSVSVSGSMSGTAGTKIVYAMNKCLIDFVRHVNPLDSELKKINKRQFKVIDKMSKDHMDFFRAQWIDGETNKTVLDTIRETACSALLFHPDVASRELLPNIKVSDMVLKISEKEAPIIRFYLYVFSLFAVMYTDVMQHAKDADGADGVDTMSDAADLATLSHVLKIVQQIQDGTYQKEEDILEEIIDEDLKSILMRMLENAMGDASESEDSKEAMTNDMPEPNLDALQNTSIGALAKEISEDLDLSDLKIERPEDIFNMAMGGGGSGGSMVSSIISKVGTKIQEKMQKGELKQEDLLRDAFSFLNTFSGGGGGDSRGGSAGSAGSAANPMAAMLNNPMMQQMMSSMMGGGGMGGLGGLGGLAASMGGAGTGQTSNHSSSATRDRLRKKYESKK